MKKWLLVPALALALVGCKSKEDRAMDLIEEFANVLDSNKDDCGKAAKAASEWTKSHEAELKELKAADSAKASDSAYNKAMEEKYKDRLKKIMEKMEGVSKKCGSDPEFQKAMSESKAF